MPKKLLGIKEITKLYRISGITIKALTKAGKLPAFKVGGQWRFDPDDMLEFWIKNKTNIRMLCLRKGRSKIAPRRPRKYG